MASLSGAIVGSSYPERDEPREGKLDRVLVAARYVTGSAATGTRQLSRIVQAVNASAVGLELLTEQDLRGRVAALRPQLRRDGFSSIALAGEAFALVREAASRTIGLRPNTLFVLGAVRQLVFGRR